MSEKTTLSEREEVELMLPWYETGQLTAEETSLVETHLRQDAELRRMLELIREEAGETVLANESAGMPSHAARDRLMAQIAAEGGEARQRGSLVSGLLKQLGLAGLSPGLAFGGALAAVVIIVQAAVITSMIGGAPTGEHPQLASGEQQTIQGGTFVWVRFSEDASAAAITGLLRKNGLIITDGPKPGGTFRVRLSDQELTGEAQTALIERLRGEASLVAFISPSR
ncbi:MAG: hypothetical protein KTR19_10965 [Hyphomicrobiales bacterium]|nr:hypothetical protein [Hyphomicrobiales bacterium]